MKYWNKVWCPLEQKRKEKQPESYRFTEKQRYCMALGASGESTFASGPVVRFFLEAMKLELPTKGCNFLFSFFGQTNRFQFVSCQKQTHHSCPTLRKNDDHSETPIFIARKKIKDAWKLRKKEFNSNQFAEILDFRTKQ